MSQAMVPYFARSVNACDRRMSWSKGRKLRGSMLAVLRWSTSRTCARVLMLTALAFSVTGLHLNIADDTRHEQAPLGNAVSSAPPKVNTLDDKPKVIFVLRKDNRSLDGTALVRGNEMAAILNGDYPGSGFEQQLAASIACDDTFCSWVQSNDLEGAIIVHIKKICRCALVAYPGPHVYDPVDELVNKGGLVGHMREDSRSAEPCSSLRSRHCVFAYFAGTSTMRQQAQMQAANLNLKVQVYHMPHHHSNFQERRHSALLDAPSQDGGLVHGASRHGQEGELIVGVAGDKWSQKPQELEACLAAQTLRDVRVRTLDELPPCVDDAVLPPSRRGDCYALRLAALDVGVVWKQNLSMVNMSVSDIEFAEKPAQRFVNMLAVGVPTVASAVYAGHVDVAKGASHITLVDNEEQLCAEVAALVRDPAKRVAASEEALRLAEVYSPAHTRDRYLWALCHMLNVYAAIHHDAPAGSAAHKREPAGGDPSVAQGQGHAAVSSTGPTSDSVGSFAKVCLGQSRFVGNLRRPPDLIGAPLPPDPLVAQVPVYPQQTDVTLPSGYIPPGGGKTSKATGKRRGCGRSGCR